MAKTKVPYNSPVGRLVQGDCFVAQTKDQQGALRVVKSGPNIGQPNPQFFVAIAVAKTDPLWPAFFQSLYDTAKLEWPALFPATGVPAPLFGIQAVHPVNPLFTFKVKDGDGIDRNGKSNATKDGFAGHWIVSAASSYAPKCAKPTSPGVWETLTDPASIKRGYYVRLAGSFAGNESANTPGMYVNLDLIELAAFGEEIIGGPDFATAFAAPAALPAGASATPMLGAGLAGGGAPAAGAPVMLAGAGGTYAELIAAGWTDALLVQHGKMAAPDAGFLGGAGAAPATTVSAPPSTVSAPPVTASPTRTMTAAANGATYDAMIAAGWTEAQLVAGGYVVLS